MKFIFSLKASSHDFLIYGRIEMIYFESCTCFENYENSVVKMTGYGREEDLSACVTRVFPLRIIKPNSSVCKIVSIENRYLIL